ncbi:hypothetical protein FPZ12_003935 [Amycolatopsis acidicola]|uniref:YCII-related domain-containing protein n=1 Tax=Amycolatopsis acidicola TaxID=2596893 RepID=A0A5N0VIM4_9PSEU|nr:YciI family protein [Amycolatopsis acidicola]KAA9166106.1 hypothetical protein FPZ12_003935 [Amycolatopsis acidicola]
MKYVLFYEAGRLDRAAELYPAHRARIDEFHRRGTLLSVGTLDDPPGSAMGVFTTRAAAEEFAGEDPLVLGGVVGAWRVAEWNEILQP